MGSHKTEFQQTPPPADPMASFNQYLQEAQKRFHYTPIAAPVALDWKINNPWLSASAPKPDFFTPPTVLKSPLQLGVNPPTTGVINTTPIMQTPKPINF
jgi:hypothetical protein